MSSDEQETVDSTIRSRKDCEVLLILTSATEQGAAGGTGWSHKNYREIGWNGMCH